MCSSWKFCVLFTTEHSATLTETPLKLKSRQRSSQESRDLLSNKRSMTNPFSQMTRQAQSSPTQRMLSIYTTSKGNHNTGLSDGIAFLTEARRVNKANTAAFAKRLHGIKRCQIDHLCAAQPFFSVCFRALTFFFFSFRLLHMCTRCKDS